MAIPYGMPRSLTVNILERAESDINALAGGGAADAPLLLPGLNIIGTSATALDSVRLGHEESGCCCRIVNNGDHDVAVYPGTDEAIDDLGANNPYILASGSVQHFMRVHSTLWTRTNRSLRFVHKAAAAVAAQGSMTMDANWIDLDCSSAVPPSARGTRGAVRFLVSVSDTAGSELSLRTNGADYGYFSTRVQADGEYQRGIHELQTDANGLIEYMATEALTAAQIYVIGYWVEG